MLMNHLFFSKGEVLQCTSYCVILWNELCVEYVLKIHTPLPNVLPWGEEAVDGDSKTKPTFHSVGDFLAFQHVLENLFPLTEGKKEHTGKTSLEAERREISLWYFSL